MAPMRLRCSQGQGVQWWLQLLKRQGTEITAVKVLPGVMYASASNVLSSLCTDRHELIQFSNCHRSYWQHRILTKVVSSFELRTHFCCIPTYKSQHQPNQLYILAMQKKTYAGGF
jgi:hypothetical protein